MAKGKNPRKPTTESVPRAAAPSRKPGPARTPFFPSLSRRQFWQQAGLIALLALVFYGNSVLNEYALDDTMVIQDNVYTQQGMAGIGKLLTEDSFAGSQGDLRLLTGGRYRPLSIITFALEYELWGLSPHLSHAINVLMFVVLCVGLLALFHKFVLPHHPRAALLAAVIFVIHPVHAEAVANIKSRDELMSLLFLGATLFLHLYALTRDRAMRGPWLAAALLAFALGLLSKENGLMFLLIIPLTSYVLGGRSVKASLLDVLPYLALIVGYLLLRVGLTGLPGESKTDVLNNPYYQATLGEQMATKVYVLAHYLGLLLWPHPLAWDYSFQQFPYLSPLDPRAWVAVLLNAGLLALGFLLAWRRSVYGYGIVFYFASIFIVSNLLINIGGVMGERFLFQGSLGFALVLGLALDQTAKRLNPGQTWPPLLLGLMGAVGLLAAIKTWERNADWRNNQTLFIGDVEAVPNSAMANRACGSAILNLADQASQQDDTARKRKLAREAIPYFKQALSIFPGYFEARLDQGSAFFMAGEVDSAAFYWNRARDLNPYHPLLVEHDRLLSQWYFERGFRVGKEEGDLDRALRLLHTSVRYDSLNHGALNSLGVVHGIRGQLDSSVYYLNRAVQLKPDETSYWLDLATTWINAGRPEEAHAAYRRILELEPGHPGARAGLQRLGPATEGMASP